MVGRPHCATVFWKTTAFRVQSQGSSRWVRPSAILFWSRETHVGSRVMSCSIVSDIIWVQCHSIASVLPWPITLTTLELSVKIWTDLCLLMSKRDYFNLMWRGASMLPNFAFLSFLIQFNIWSAVARNDQLGCKQSILQWGDTKCMYLMSSVWNTWTQVLEVLHKVRCSHFLLFSGLCFPSPFFLFLGEHNSLFSMLPPLPHLFSIF